jgi:hypothetical protein
VITPDAIRIEMADRVGDICRAVGGSSVKERITRAARLLGITPRRCAAFVYQEISVVPAHEMDTVRAKHMDAKRLRLAQLQTEFEALRNELVAEAPAGLVALVPNSTSAAADQKEPIKQ